MITEIVVGLVSSFISGNIIGGFIIYNGLYRIKPSVKGFKYPNKRTKLYDLSMLVVMINEGIKKKMDCYCTTCYSFNEEYIKQLIVENGYEVTTTIRYDNNIEITKSLRNITFIHFKDSESAKL